MRSLRFHVRDFEKHNGRSNHARRFYNFLIGGLHTPPQDQAPRVQLSPGARIVDEDGNTPATLHDSWSPRSKIVHLNKLRVKRRKRKLFESPETNETNENKPTSPADAPTPPTEPNSPQEDKEEQEDKEDNPPTKRRPKES